MSAADKIRSFAKSSEPDSVPLSEGALSYGDMRELHRNMLGVAHAIATLCGQVNELRAKTGIGCYCGRIPEAAMDKEWSCGAYKCRPDPMAPRYCSYCGNRAGSAACQAQHP